MSKTRENFLERVNEQFVESALGRCETDAVNLLREIDAEDMALYQETDFWLGFNDIYFPISGDKASLDFLKAMADKNCSRI